MIMSFAVGCGQEEVETKPVVRPIKMLDLSAGSTGEVLEYPGQVEPLQNVEMAFEVSGKVTAFPVSEGQFVKKGEVIARLDPRDYKAQLDAAEARERQTKATLGRQQKLFDEGRAAS